jgi:hypothetical protein
MSLVKVHIPTPWILVMDLLKFSIMKSLRWHAVVIRLLVIALPTIYLHGEYHGLKEIGIESPPMVTHTKCLGFRFVPLQFDSFQKTAPPGLDVPYALKPVSALVLLFRLRATY